MEEKPKGQLKPLDYTKEECDRIIEYVGALRLDHIRNFLGKRNLPKWDSKAELLENIKKWVNDKTLHYIDLIELLDSVSPWGKQHVILYYGPTSDISNWRNINWVTSHLTKHNMGKYLNTRLPLILPEKLTLSSIEHTDSSLHVLAVMRRDYAERDQRYDGKDRKTEDGKTIKLRAYIIHVIRGLVVFAFVFFGQLSQLIIII